MDMKKTTMQTSDDWEWVKLAMMIVCAIAVCAVVVYHFTRNEFTYHSRYE